ncbi:MAG: cytochrome c oxidase assembly protein [Solirubrobacterales bacterium]|nr:cytochrome c oxidase assembly protein [Solirubrobacterales bacterium]
MSSHALIGDWSVDGPVGAVFLVLVVYVGCVYIVAARYGTARDRRGRRWPRRRTACFLAGLAALVADLYSGIGTLADTRLAVHMVEHMVLWVVVAPLLLAAAPVRLAFFALPREGRRRLARALHSRLVGAITAPIGSVALFSTVMLVCHIPAVYGLALTNDSVHEAEHGLFLLASVIMWAPMLGSDPLPARAGPVGRAAGMVVCMIPMALIAIWLQTAPDAVYAHYVGSLGRSALDDQHLAATIMWCAGLPALAVPALRHLAAAPRLCSLALKGRRPGRSPTPVHLPKSPTSIGGSVP